MAKDISLIILAAGRSSRFEKRVAKQWLRVGKIPLWLFVLKRLKSFYPFKKIVISSREDEVAYMQNFISEKNIKIVTGGKERQDSLKNAVEEIDSEYVLVTDVARACISKKMVELLSMIDSDFDSLLPYIDINDTVYYDDKVIDRTRLKRVQTPQLSLTKSLRKALQNTKKIYTDESSLILDFGGKIEFIKGEDAAEKITFKSDLKKLECLEPPSNDIFSGNGFDVHSFEKNKKMFLCGVHIKENYGFKAHSDGDVAIHALIDALLGAMGSGDIGELFPDTDNRFKDIDSKILLQEVVKKLTRFGYEIINIDITIIAEWPKLKEYKQKMREKLSEILDLHKAFINIKATTAEKMGFVGRKEGVAVLANANLKFYRWDYGKRKTENGKQIMEKMGI